MNKLRAANFLEAFRDFLFSPSLIRVMHKDWSLLQDCPCPCLWMSGGSRAQLCAPSQFPASLCICAAHCASCSSLITAIQHSARCSSACIPLSLDAHKAVSSHEEGIKRSSLSSIAMVPSQAVRPFLWLMCTQSTHLMSRRRLR